MMFKYLTVYAFYCRSTGLALPMVPIPIATNSTNNHHILASIGLLPMKCSEVLLIDTIRLRLKRTKDLHLYSALTVTVCDVHSLAGYTKAMEQAIAILLPQHRIIIALHNSIH